MSEETAGREQLLDEIIARILEVREGGEEQSQEEVLARYPEFTKELEEFFENERVTAYVLRSDDPPPNFGSDYKVLEEIGRGGMGIVYKAHQESLNKTVAIKTIIAGQLATESEVERIYKEARRAARLRHPNIVTVHQVAEREGHHFFVMEYIEGKSLADLIDDGPVSSTQAAHYSRTVAEAIHYAHQRQILHCDLKPANIVLDEQGKAHVTDFGLAKRLGEDTRYLPSSAVGGTAGYMAPEQVSADELTTATDVYGLGAVLYALLTGRSPFRGKTLKETLRLVRSEPPEPPNQRNPDADKDLEAICLKCLGKEKDERYRSADAMAEDLVRCQAGEETTARPWGRRERVFRWCRENLVAAGGLAAVVTISILTIVMALSVAQARKVALREAALRSNSFAARDLAATALLQLQSLTKAVEMAAADSSVADLLARDDRQALRQYLEQISSEQPRTFASCFILNSEGVIVVRVPPQDEGLAGYSFHWREYFRGAKGHSGRVGTESVHISSVYRGKVDDLYKFAISAPIWHKGKFLGAISTSVTTDATMGLVYLHDDRRQVVLIAPKDVEEPGLETLSQLSKYVILFHPAYRRGVPAVEYSDSSKIVSQLERNHAKELEQPDPNLLLPSNDDYEDPVGSVLRDYEGRWIAGFAPIGHTGFAVIVQQHFEQAVRLDPSVLWSLVFWSALVSCLAIAVVGMLLWRWGRH